MINSSDELDKYIIDHSDDLSTYLHDITRNTFLKTTQPRMLSGPIQGLFLKMLVKMINPSRILEIGTFTAYSAVCMAEGLSKGYEIDTIEIEEELRDIIEENISNAGFENIIKCYWGNALDIIPSLNKNYDMVFIDGNKRNYLDYYHAVFDKVNSGGYILADNVLWDGHVINPAKVNDPQTKGIMEFNDFVKNDDRVEKFLLPLRDGIMIIKKI